MPPQLAVCVAAWSQVGPLYRAAERREEPGLPSDRLRAETPREPRESRGDGALLAARGVGFRHRGRGRAALLDLDLDLAPGEKVLVEGPSGGGKSTLASLLAGWRTPESGSVLLAGLDRRAWGAAGWRARVASAPQFHENRIFSASLLFNLLLGTPSQGSDASEEARAMLVCRELGLADLVARMPSGLRQLVGETGWQLSHGERGRVFVARALLSGALSGERAGGNLVVLDESLAGLDPESAREVLDALLARPEALVLMAHP